MIQLFNIPNYTIDTSQFSNLLHDKIVREFEQKFAQYVGAKYAVSFNSATSAIFLICNRLIKYKTVCIPSIIPPVVPNAIINAGVECIFTNNTIWVGSKYRMVTFEDYDIVDSAQEVQKDGFKDYCDDEDLMIFSFYPTKPVGSCDGGMVVSNDEDKIEWLRELTFNGMSFAENNWDRKLSSIGHKMYMNSIQAYIADKNLDKLDQKKEQLNRVREIYNREFNLNNTSDHLYRIRVDDNKKFIKFAKEKGAICGIHYEPCHTNKLYNNKETIFTQSEVDGWQMVSIPFHEALTSNQVEQVIDIVNEYYRR